MSRGSTKFFQTNPTNLVSVVLVREQWKYLNKAVAFNAFPFIHLLFPYAIFPSFFVDLQIIDVINLTVAYCLHKNTFAARCTITQNAIHCDLGTRVLLSQHIIKCSAVKVQASRNKSRFIGELKRRHKLKERQASFSHLCWQNWSKDHLKREYTTEYTE